MKKYFISFLYCYHWKWSPFTVIAFTVFFFYSDTGSAQVDLIANGTFTDINKCTEYKAGCCPSGWILVSPTLPFYNRKAVGITIFNTGRANVRQYLEQQLLEPLLEGVSYNFSITVWKDQIPATSLGIHFSDSFICTQRETLLKLDPSIDLTSQLVNSKFKKGKKVIINYSYTAKGNERFIIIGNFQNDSEQLRINSAKVTSYKNYNIYINGIHLIAATPSGTLELLSKRKDYLYSYHDRHSGCTYKPFPYSVSREIKPAPESVVVEIPKKIDTIVLNNILFASNSALISDKHKLEIIEKLKKIDKEQLKFIQIEGHTDNVGDNESNLILSRQRADVIYLILIDMTISPEKIKATGYGETFPKYDNETTEGRQGNRRIELLITYF